MSLSIAGSNGSCRWIVRSVVGLLGARNWLLLVIWTWAHPTNGEEYQFFHEGILGTSCEMRIDVVPGSENGSASQQAVAVEQVVLNEIERLNQILSRYQPESELVRFQSAQVGTRWKASPDFLAALQLADHWQGVTQGAFCPGIQVLTELWQSGVREGQVPTAERLEEATLQARQPHWQISERNVVRRLSNSPLVLDGLAKGYIIDRGVAAALDVPGVRGIMLNIGGDLCVRGSLVSRVGIADPIHDADNLPSLCQIRVENQGLATSGNYRRGMKIGDRWYSHLIDPHGGYPVDHVVSASVLAPDTVTADALATALSILPLQEGLSLAESLDQVECLLIDPRGRQYRSSGWDRRAATETTTKQVAAIADKPDAKPDESASDTNHKSARSEDVPGLESESEKETPARTLSWPKDFELLVEYEIRGTSSRGYRRPYVAVWLEDQEGFPVRTLQLFLQKSDPGPRWHRDLRRWYRSDQMRQLVEESNLIQTVSMATRPPGKYKVIWDGKNDAGEPVNGGKYTLYLEAAREHGTYQLMKKELELIGEPFAGEFKENQEIKGARFEFRLTKKDTSDESE